MNDKARRVPKRQRYRAKWLIDPVVGAVENAALVVDGSRIVFAGRFSDLRRSAAGFIDLGAAALLPGLANAHIHLDLTALRNPPTEPGFVPWLNAVIAQRRDSAPDSVATTIAANLEAAIATGTTLLGDIATTDASENALRRSGIRGVVFREILGRRPERFEPLWNWATGIGLDTARSVARSRKVIRGLTPHAPFSTSEAVFLRAGKIGGLLATHWRESLEELEFLSTGAGPMAKFLQSLGAVEPGFEAADQSSAALERRLLGAGGQWLLIHANYLDDETISELGTAKLQKQIAGVVYCPRTHARFGHRMHPWRRILAAAIPVALGTDSLASNPDLSLWNEAKFLWYCEPATDPLAMLSMIADTPARMLGFADTGRLAPGYRADMCIASGCFVEEDDPLRNLFAGDVQVNAGLAGGKLLVAGLNGASTRQAP